MKKVFVVLLVLVMALTLLPSQTVYAAAPVCKGCGEQMFIAVSKNNGTHCWYCGTPGCPQRGIRTSYTEPCSGGTATCTERARCDVCHDYYGEPLGHDLVHHDAQEPTCTEAGWDAYDTCSRCNYTTKVERAAKGHTVVTDKGKAATCTKAGLTAGKHCSVCGQVLKKQKKVAAKGHLYQSWEPAEEGKHRASCARCGHGTVGDCVAVAVPQADPNAAPMTLCPVCGHREGGDLVPVTDARAKGGTGDLVVFMTEGEEERLLTVAFQRNGKLQQPKGTVTLTLPASLAEGYDLLLIGPDGTESPITARAGKDGVTLSLPFGDGPVCFLRLRPQA